MKSGNEKKSNNSKNKKGEANKIKNENRYQEKDVFFFYIERLK